MESGKWPFENGEKKGVKSTVSRGDALLKTLQCSPPSVNKCFNQPEEGRGCQHCPHPCFARLREARQCTCNLSRLESTRAPDKDFLLYVKPSMDIETLAVLAPRSSWYTFPFTQVQKWRPQYHPRISSGGKLKTMSRRKTSAQPWCSVKSWRSWWVS